MKKLNFDEMREQLEQKEERYNGLMWVASAIANSAKWELESDNPDIRDKDDSEITIDDFKQSEWGSWSNRRGKYEAMKEVLDYIDKLITKL